MQKKRRFHEIGLNIVNNESKSSKTHKLPKTSIKSPNELLEDIANRFDQKKAIQDLVNNAPNVNQIDSGGLIGLIQTLEKSSLKNSQMRTKYVDNPKKFMQSELELAQAIKNLNEITVVPSLYGKLVQLDFSKIAYDLLSHENTDIVIETINLLNELIDPEAILEDKVTLKFIESAKESKLFSLAAKNLDRLAENEEDSEGLNNALSIFEKLMEIDLKFFLSLLSEKNLLKFIIKSIGKCNYKDNRNRHYCAEILANCINLTPAVCPFLSEYDFFGAIQLSLNNSIKNIKNFNSDDSEFVNNLFDIFTLFYLISRTKPQINPRLIKNILFFLKKKKFSCRSSAINALSSVLMNSPENCKIFIDEQGLKNIFVIFLQYTKLTVRSNGIRKDLTQEKINIIEQSSIIFLQCFINLKNIQYLRFLRKFIEKDFEKIDALVMAFDYFYSKLEETDKKITTEKSFKRFDNRKQFLYRYEKGGYIVSLMGSILIFLLTCGNLALKQRVQQVLSQRDISLNDIVSVLKETKDNMEESESHKPIKKNIVVNLLKMISGKED